MSDFYPTLLTIHGYARWLALVAALFLVFACILGLTARKPFKPLGRIASILYVSLLDLQLLIGLALYAASPIIRTALDDPGAAMKTRDIRFFFVEHLIVMLAAIALAHIGTAKAKRMTEPLRQYKCLLIWCGISIVLLLGGIPWWRPLFR